MTIVEFLEARLAEDEAEAGVTSHRLSCQSLDQAGEVMWPDDCTCGGPARTLREVAAKRAILAAAALVIDTYRGGVALDLAWESGRALASVYSDHPDFDPAWVAEAIQPA